MLIVAIVIGLLLSWALFAISDVLSKPLQGPGSRIAKVAIVSFVIGLGVAHVYELDGPVIGFMLLQSLLLFLTGLAICFRDRNIAQNEEIKKERLEKAQARKEKEERSSSKKDHASTKASKATEHRRSSAGSAPAAAASPALMDPPESEIAAPLDLTSA